MTLGLAHLAEARYAEAAKIFASLSLELTNQFASVISAEDIALYGSILGMATMDRHLLHTCVIDGIFKGRLEVCFCAYVFFFDMRSYLPPATSLDLVFIEIHLSFFSSSSL